MFSDTEYPKIGYFGLFLAIFYVMANGITEGCIRVSSSFRVRVRIRINFRVGFRVIVRLYPDLYNCQKMSYPCSTPFIGPICKNLERAHFFF